MMWNQLPIDWCNNYNTLLKTKNVKVTIEWSVLLLQFWEIRGHILSHILWILKFLKVSFSPFRKKFQGNTVDSFNLAPDSLALKEIDPRLEVWCMYYFCTYIYISWINQCVTKTGGWGTSHKYTNLQCKILQTFDKNSILYHLYK